MGHTRSAALVIPLLALLPACAAQSQLGDTCATPSVDTSSWQLVDAGDFSFRVPPEFSARDVRGVDSQVGAWEAGASEIAYDYGWYSNNLDPHGTEVAYTSCTARIGGRSARVVTHGDAATGYFAGAHWLVHQGREQSPEQPVYLTLTATSPDRDRIERLRAVLWTVTFDDAADR